MEHAGCLSHNGGSPTTTGQFGPSEPPTCMWVLVAAVWLNRRRDSPLAGLKSACGGAPRDASVVVSEENGGRSASATPYSET